MNKKKKLDQNTIQTAKRLLKYMTGTHKIQFIIVFICIFISSAASIAVSLSLKFLLDDFIIPLIGQTDPNFAELYKALAVLGCIFALGVIATFIYTRMMVYIGQGVLKSVRDDMFEHMQTLPIRYFDQNTNGSVMSLYTNDTDTLRQMISQAIPQALMALFTIVVTFISMLLLSPLLTILAVVIIFIMLKVTNKIGSNSGKYFIRQQVSLADVTGFVEERMNGQRVVKVFNHEDKSKEEFDKLNEALFESSANANKYGNMMGPVIGNIGNLQFVLTAVLGGLLSVTGVGGITLGVMASYLQFTKSFTQPFMQVAQQFNAIVMALAGAERIFRLIDEKPEEDEGYVELVNARKDANGNITECKERTGMWAWKHPHSADGSVTYTELTGDVRFEDVTFGYNPDKVILKDISLFAKPGQKLAFVGSTGAGKTTMIKLLCGLLIPTRGTIRINGVSSTDIKREDYYRLFSTVFQDIHLFPASIQRNIVCRDDQIDQVRFEDAVKKSGMDEVAQKFRDGLNTLLVAEVDEEAVNLSGGQVQKLMLARAIYKNAPILLLDEPTAALDPIAEKDIYLQYNEMTEGKMSIFISHRLASTVFCDRIFFMKNGIISEEGTHEELLQKKGDYYEAFSVQSKYYQEEKGESSEGA